MLIQNFLSIQKASLAFLHAKTGCRVFTENRRYQGFFQKILLKPIIPIETSNALNITFANNFFKSINYFFDHYVTGHSNIDI